MLFPELGQPDVVPSIYGRPIKFDANRKKVLLDALRGGSTRTAACALADISLETLRQHAARDLEFLGMVVKAEEEAVTRYASRIQKAAYESEVIETFGPTGALQRRVTKYDWKAAAWWLEHHPSTRKVFGAQAEPPAQTLVIVNPSTPAPDSGWKPDQAFAAQVVAILQRSGQLPEEVAPDDLAPVLLAPPEQVPPA